MRHLALIPAIALMLPYLALLLVREAVAWLTKRVEDAIVWLWRASDRPVKRAP
jgi:hypothetical protein